MLQLSKRQQDAQRADSVKRLRGSVSKWGRVQADPLMMSRCSTWQNASQKERDENAEDPWRKPIPIEEFEVESKPLHVGPITLWQAAMITKDDLMMIEFSRDETSWTKLHRSKNYSVARMFLREKPESLKFMVIVTDPRNLSTREVIKVFRDITEGLPLTYLARASLEFLPLQPIKPPVLPTPPREKKRLIVEAVESGKDDDAGNAHDDRAKVDLIDKNKSNDTSSSKVDKTNN